MLQVGVGSAASASCSCPTSTSAATPRTRWACRSTRWWSGIRTRSGGGLTPEQAARRAKLILWKGHCSVHTRFTVQQIERVREQHPGVRVIVHPEVPFDVVQAADDSGSTEYIIKTVAGSPAGSSGPSAPRFISSTAWRTRSRPARPWSRSISSGCLCSTMFRVSPNHLLWVLEGLVEGQRPQPDRRPGRPEALGQGRAGSDAAIRTERTRHRASELRIQLPSRHTHRDLSSRHVTSHSVHRFAVDASHRGECNGPSTASPAL